MATKKQKLRRRLAAAAAVFAAAKAWSAVRSASQSAADAPGLPLVVGAVDRPAAYQAPIGVSAGNSIYVNALDK